MAKQFKLIKEYPGSPPLKTIAEAAFDIKYIYPDNKINFVSSSNENLFKKLIENQPEFWQEIKEPEYEILTLRCNNGHIISYEKGDISGGTCYGKKSFNKIYKSKDFWLECFVTNNPNLWEIYSVKRLSDGEVFTLGDKIVSANIVNTILAFEFILNNQLRIKGDNCYLDINSLVKVKTPLFTTEDGKEIFEDQTFYFVKIKKSLSLDPMWEAISAKLPSNTFILEPEFEKYFATKKAAEMYIFYNKPCLSLADVGTIYTTARTKPHPLEYKNSQKNRIFNMVFKKTNIKI